MREGRIVVKQDWDFNCKSTVPYLDRLKILTRETPGRRVHLYWSGDIQKSK